MFDVQFINLWQMPRFGLHLLHKQHLDILLNCSTGRSPFAENSTRCFLNCDGPQELLLNSPT